MSIIRAIIIFQFINLCFASEISKSVYLNTGSKLAVLEFSGEGLSEPLRLFLTEEFRKTIRDLKVYRVQNKGISNQFSILNPNKKDYWSYLSEGCAIDLGKKLNVNYIIAGKIEQNGDDEFLINGRLFSVDLETMVNEFSINSSGASDSLLLDMKKMAYDVSGLPIPDNLSVESDTSQVAVSKKIIRKRIWPQLPPMPSKIKALMMSTALPGSGQIWAKRKFHGYTFMSIEAILGVSTLIAYYQYDIAWGGFQETYQSYQIETDPHNLLELRPQIIQYVSDTKKYNLFMKNVRNIGALIWVINMAHAYIVAPNDDFFDGDYYFDFEYKPDANKIQFNYRF